MGVRLNKDTKHRLEALSKARDRSPQLPPHSNQRLLQSLALP